MQKQSLIDKIEYSLTPLTSIGDKPTDSEEKKLQHRFLIYMGMLMGFGGIVWGNMAAYFNLFLPSLIPYGYTVLTVINFTTFYFAKNFEAVRFFQVLISLLLPFLFQWSLGGFVPSGAVMLWAMFALVGAFTFQSIELNIRWLTAYLVLTVFSGLIDNQVAIYGIQVSATVTTLFFVLNIFVVSAVVFGLSFYLSAKQKDMLSELKIFSTAVEQTTDSVVITNLQGDIAYVNQAFEQTTGYTKEEVIGRSSNLLKSGRHDSHFYKRLWQILLSGNTFYAEVVNKKKNDELYDEEKVIIPLKNEKNQITHFVSMGRDVTERKHAEQERLHLKVIQQELSIARDMQKSLLPPTHPNWSYIDVVCFSTPAKDVGGDFYQYYRFAPQQSDKIPPRTSNLNRHAFAVGDVSGKGVSAALLMATSLSQLDASFLLDLSPEKRLAHLDNAILPYTKPRRQNCAMCYVEIGGIEDRGERGEDGGGERMEEGRIEDGKEDGEHCNSPSPSKPPSSKPQTSILPSSKPPSSSLTIVNAGCIPPYIKRVDGVVEFHEMGGFALGQGFGAELGYQQKTVALSKGDMVILVSDGVVEANNATGEMLGFDRLEQIVREFSPSHHVDSSSETMLNYLRQAINTFIGQAEQHDDMTIMVVRVIN